MAVAGKSARSAPNPSDSLSGTRVDWRGPPPSWFAAPPIDWAALFNTDADQHGKAPADLIDPLLHKPADEIKNWPDIDLFPRF